jgi:hypothetical protein
MNDIDFLKPSLTVAGKGSVSREIALEKKGPPSAQKLLGGATGQSFGTALFKL